MYDAIDTLNRARSEHGDRGLGLVKEEVDKGLIYARTNLVTPADEQLSAR